MLAWGEGLAYVFPVLAPGNSLDSQERLQQLLECTLARWPPPPDTRIGDRRGGQVPHESKTVTQGPSLLTTC